MKYKSEKKSQFDSESLDLFIVTDDFGGFDTRFKPRTHSWMQREKKYLENVELGIEQRTRMTGNHAKTFGRTSFFLLSQHFIKSMQHISQCGFEPVARFLLYLVLCMHNSYEFFPLRTIVCYFHWCTIKFMVLNILYQTPQAVYT